jgi:arsenite-transporting ATPase
MGCDFLGGVWHLMRVIATPTRLHFVLGKGGVGRTTTAGALALALREASGGAAVLVVEMDELSTEAGGADAPGNFPALLRAFGHAESETPATPEEAFWPRPVAPGIDAARLTAACGHEAFLKSALPGGVMLTGALRSRPIRRFLESAPAFHEMGQMAHLAALVGALDGVSPPRRYAHAVVDLPATGHALALAELPDAARKIIPVGPVARGLAEVQACMRDPRRSDVWVVTLPETLPVSETLELLEALRTHGQPAPRIVVNRWPADPFDGAEPAARAAAAALVARHPEVRGARAFRALIEAREATARLPETLTVVRSPHRPDLSGQALLTALASALRPTAGGVR